MNQRCDVLARLQLVMGDLPEAARRVPLDVQVVEEVHAEGFLRQRITFATEPGHRAWAWLLVPPAPRGPALLCLHQTTAIGKDEPAGLGGLPNLHYALELTQRGYFFQHGGVRECVALVASENCVCCHPDCAHDFPPDVREAAYQFVDRAFQS